MAFQALGRDLLHVSVQLESLEEQLQSSRSVRQSGGVTIEELEEERDTLKKRRDALDAQLKDNRVLTVEVRKEGTLYVCTVLVNCHLTVHQCASFFLLCTLICVCVFV